MTTEVNIEQVRAQCHVTWKSDAVDMRPANKFKQTASVSQNQHAELWDTMTAKQEIPTSQIERGV